MNRILVDSEKCVCCGDCSLICPVRVYSVLPAPCQISCPLDTDVMTYISYIAQGRFDEALATIKQTNPFPGILSRVCTHPCENQCRRGEIDHPVAIRELKRAATEIGSYVNTLTKYPQKERPEKVAIIGSGPTGLIAAYDLRMLGYQVTIFDSLPIAGGMLSVGIPEYRLPNEIVKAEISQIEHMGVEIKLNTTLGKDIGLRDLLEQGYSAVLVAIGTHRSLKLDIPGEDEFDEVMDSISFLREVNLGNIRNMSGKAIVVGGGNAAIDSARTLVRLGCAEVSIAYRREKQQMRVTESEIVEAEKEGVKIFTLVVPTKVTGNNKKVTGLGCARTRLDKIDDDGRRSWVKIDDSDFVIDADIVISAIGQIPDLSLQNEYIGLDLAGKHINIDTDNMTTSIPGIFAAGDVVTGPTTVIDCMASGRKSAISIHKYISKETLIQKDLNNIGRESEPGKQIWWKQIAKCQRQEIDEIKLEERYLNFSEVNLGLTQSMAMKEARRCLGCAIFNNIDVASCCGNSCRACQFACWKEAILIQQGI